MRRTALFVGLCLFVVVMAHMAAGQQVVKRKAPVHETRYLEYEGVLTGPLGETKTGEFSMTFRVYDSLTGTASLWEETREVTVRDGEFSVTLGTRVPIPTRGEEFYYIGIVIDGEELSPRQELSSFGGGIQSRGPVGEGLLDVGKNRESFVFQDGDWDYWSNAPHMYSIPGGNVGIGTTGPNEALEVTGRALIRDPGNNGALILSPSTGGYGVDPELVIQSSEMGSGDDAVFHISRNALFDTVIDTYQYIDDVGEPASMMELDGDGNFTFSYASSGTGDISWTENVFFEGSSGNVGIGTVTPASELDVEGTVEMTGLKLSTGASNGYVLTSDGSGTGTWQAVAGGGGGWSDDGTVVRLATGSDSVGIGTSTPTAKLDVIGSSDWVLLRSTNMDGGAAISGISNGSSSGIVTGVAGSASNSGSGTAWAGRFVADSSGTGAHYGVFSEGYGTSSYSSYGSYNKAGHRGSGWTFGVYGDAENSGTGDAYGGYFLTDDGGGTGMYHGVYGEAEASSSSWTYGSYGYGNNTGSGTAVGGRFYVPSSGTGTHYAQRATAYGASSSTTYGTYSSGSNTDSGNVYGGLFTTSSGGTGYHYGLYAGGYGSSSNPTYGTLSYADNTSNGAVYGGHFETSSNGTGFHYGVYTFGRGSASNSTYGISSYGEGSGSGAVFGGDYYVSSAGTGTHYGLSASSYGAASANTIGIDGYASNSSTGWVYGGWFSTDDAGTGPHYGIRTSGYASSSGNAFGTYGFGENTGSGNTYAGYFFASTSGTGSHYGVYGYEAPGGSGAAVYASGDMLASGTKPAVVKTSSGHRLLYAMESPEVWFEDFGEGELVKGKAHIELDPLFLETVTIDDSHPMKVFIQLNDENCRGTAVHRGLTGFNVVELSGGTSNAAFSYRVIAKRKGYEDERLRETDAGYDDPNLYPELLAEIEKLHEKERNSQELEREKQMNERQNVEDEQRRQEEMRREELRQDNLEEQRQIEETRSAALQHEKLRTEGVR